MKIDIKKLKDTQHMFTWLSSDPMNEMITIIESMFQEQVKSTELQSFKVVEDPQWLTSGKKTEKENKVILSKSAVAVACEFVLKDVNGTYHLKGIFTWAASNLDEAPKHKQWMDLDGTLEEFGSGGLLAERIYMDL